VAEEEVMKEVAKFFSNETLEKVPSIRIGAALVAALAHEAARGRKKVPTAGFTADMEIVSSYIPYCDAIFIDNENARLLSLPAARAKIGFPTRIFSQATKQEFLDYLDELYAAADPELIKVVRQVYGDDWDKPYDTILIDEKEDGA
jgi:hypothetical protein